MPRPRDDPYEPVYMDDRDLEAGRRAKYPAQPAPPPPPPPPGYGAPPPPGYGAAPYPDYADRERERDRDRPRRRRDDDYPPPPSGGKGKLAGFFTAAKELQKQYKQATGTHASPDRRPRRHYSDSDDESPPPRRERRRSPKPTARPRRHYDSDDSSPPPPRRHRDRERDRDYGRDRPRRRDPDPRDYDNMFDDYGRDRRRGERPDKYDKYAGYYSDNRHDRARHRSYPDDPYGRDDRYRERDPYGRDKRRPGPGGRKESKWQQEAASMFKQYALPVIKAEGGKYISKQLGGFMAAQAGKR